MSEVAILSNTLSHLCIIDILYQFNKNHTNVAYKNRFFGILVEFRFRGKQRSQLMIRMDMMHEAIATQSSLVGCMS